MLSLPDEHELIGFFEVEPELLDGSIKPWIYNEIKFTTTRGDDTIIVTIYASFGELTATWIKSEIQLINIKLIKIDKINIEMNPNDEFLTAEGKLSDHAVSLKITLKPHVAIDFSQERIR